MPTVTVVTDRGQQNVEIQSDQSIWNILEAVSAADPNMQIRFVDNLGRSQSLNATQARNTYPTPGSRITATPKGVNAAK